MFCRVACFFRVGSQVYCNVTECVNTVEMRKHENYSLYVVHESDVACNYVVLDYSFDE